MKRKMQAITGALAAFSLMLGSAAVLAQSDSTTLPSPPVGSETTDQSKDQDKSKSKSKSGSQSAPATPGSGTLDSGPLGSSSGTSGMSGGATAKSDFGTLDTNGDGSLNRDELRANARLASRFSQMDSNGDGRVTEREYSVSASPSEGVTTQQRGNDRSKSTTGGQKQKDTNTEKGDGSPDAEDISDRVN